LTEKTIDTLVEDIYELVDKGLPEGYDDEKIRDLGVSISRVILARLTDRGPRKGMLRMSNVGKPCNRQLYYEVNDPEGQEALPPPRGLSSSSETSSKNSSCSYQRRRDIVSKDVRTLSN
jgi:hypothetical protein